MSDIPERTCLYCARKIAPEDRVAMCDVCYVGHHEDCWQRNGRCSTFRCGGSPSIMWGVDYARALSDALTAANAEPRSCPLCGGRVYGGTIRAKSAQSASSPTRSGLAFVVRHRSKEQNTGLARRVAGRLFGRRRWCLPGAELAARSCGNCRALFLWGLLIDEAFVQIAREQALDRFCAHCGTSMWAGDIPLRMHGAAQARFWSDTTPEFHRDWVLHNLLDRFVYNRWTVSVPSLPASSCPQCRYTEISGRPIYRFA